MTPPEAAPMRDDVTQADRDRVKAISERLLSAMRRVARQDGWALGVHGSMSRDLDLIAVPWVENAVTEAAFVEAMRATVAREIGGISLIGAGEDGRTPGVKEKPNGRRCWTIHSTSEDLVENHIGAHPYIDLAVLDNRLAHTARPDAAPNLNSYIDGYEDAQEVAARPDAGDEVERVAFKFLCERLQRDPVHSEESDTCSLRSASKAMAAFLAAMREGGGRGMVEQYRHVKRGTVYEMIGTAELQAEQPQCEHAELAIYRGEDGKLWARNTAEFHDGRFEPLSRGGEVRG